MLPPGPATVLEGNSEHLIVIELNFAPFCVHLRQSCLHDYVVYTF